MVTAASTQEALSPQKNKSKKHSAATSLTKAMWSM
jgi:hypothetical protein